MNRTSLLLRSALSLLLMALASSSWAQNDAAVSITEPAGDFEPPGAIKASAVLQPDMRAGDHFTVREEVGSDGYWRIYTVDTKFGAFVAHGWFDLSNLIHEINALAYLDQFTQSEMYRERAAANGVDTIDFTGTDPRASNELPRGVGQLFRRYAWQASTGFEFAYKGMGGRLGDEDATLAKEACAQGIEPNRGECDRDSFKADLRRLRTKYFGVDDADRAWHERLGTDPNTTNEVLLDAVSQLSWAVGLEHEGADQPTSSGPRFLGITPRDCRLVWSMDPYEMHKHVFDELQSMGVEDPLIKYFFGSPFVSPTKQCFIVESFRAIKDVPGAKSVLQWAAHSRTEDEALYTTVTVALIAWNHNRSPLARFLPDTALPLLETLDGRLVAMLPIDHLYWTPEIATLLHRAMERDDVQQISPREIWLTGSASEQARTELEERGWTVRQNGIEMLLAQ